MAGGSGARWKRESALGKVGNVCSWWGAGGGAGLEQEYGAAATSEAARVSYTRPLALLLLLGVGGDWSSRSEFEFSKPDFKTCRVRSFELALCVVWSTC